MKLNAKDIALMKGTRQIAMLTAYNTPIARYIEKVGVPVILVGDTLAMVEMGFEGSRRGHRSHFHILDDARLS